ncbi:histidine phosphatase family protein [Saccharopolyspora mangrovi]|uniref:Histidine phosphatase family protein n=1 Tax=Saccharopolyspora mangrovi TaxID=3082379 RepID=A0ABU6A9P9_9PSEU|nr:histidine phosphatase family protein [Saccharopolyspora sp. S2-29]MEB3368192.1 histidine phosphatase family protein [Saccharopolyspora sp. S2-29]
MEQRVYILRHGTTEWSLTGQHTSRTDIPLTVEGELRARQAGQVLTALRPAGPVLVLCSPRERAQRTADLAGLSDVVTEPLLVEWDYGDYEGLTTEQIRETDPDWTVWSHPCPGGETASNVATRADDLLTRVREAGRDVVLVGHGHFSRCLIARWLNLPISAGVHFALDPAGITVLGHDRGVAQIHRSNVPAWQHG